MPSLRDLAQELARESVAPHADAVDREARFPQQALAALKDARLLAAALPRAQGGLGATLTDLSDICEVLGRACSATGMVYAMHQSQVACLLHHGLGQERWDCLAQELAQHQSLIASITSEVGVGGDIRTSRCALQPRADGGLSLTKKATTLSYGAHADFYLATCRRTPDSDSGDQVLALLRRECVQLEQTGGWDTLGMRGTCSPGFIVTGTLAPDDVLPAPFAEICPQTMAPVSHLLWSAVWLGIAADGLLRARAYLRERAKTAPSAATTGELRLAEAMGQLQLGRANLNECLRTYETLRAAEDRRGLASFEWMVRINNLKTATSELIVPLLHQCLAITGIAGYRNDSPYSLGRHLRDALSASLMIGNERLNTVSGSLLLVQKGI